jgi:aspartyl protease
MLTAFITLAALSWAVPIFGTAHFIIRDAVARKRNQRENIGPAKQVDRRTPLPLPVRFQDVRNRGLVVTAWVNGFGPFRFAIDTGAGLTLVSQRLVSEARLTNRPGRRTVFAGLSGASVSSNNEAVIGSIALGDRNNLLPSSSMAIVAPSLPSDLDGILDPIEAFSPLGCTIDMPNHQISAFDPSLEVLSPSNSPPDGAVVRWLRDSQSQRPFVRLGDGRLALIDTGSGFGLAVSDHSAIVVGDGGRRDGDGVIDIGGGIVSSTRVRPTTVSIGSLVLRGVPTDILTGVARGAPVILGRDALYPFRISFNPVRRLIEIAPVVENGR